MGVITIDETVFFFLKNKHKIKTSLYELKQYLDSFNFLIINPEIKEGCFY